VREAFRGRQATVLSLKADASLVYGALVETIDRVKRAGREDAGRHDVRLEAHWRGGP
jgi:hypothetical protein